MQLILDADNIDIERTMSTIEQDALNEKFHSNKVIDHLADDITTGNKENIQKQENIILDVGEENVIDTAKEISSSGAVTVINNLHEEKSNEITVDTEDVKISEEIIDDKDFKNTPNEVSNAETVENVNTDKSSIELNEPKLEESNNTDVTETELRGENEIDPVNINTKQIVDVTMTVKENVMEISTELIQKNEINLDKEVDISELSTELNEEKEMDLDKEVNVSDVSAEINQEAGIEMDETVDEKVLEKESVQSEVINTSLHDKIHNVDCPEIEPSEIIETNEKIASIEIDDEDDKTSEKSSRSSQNVEEVRENVDNIKEAELIKATDKSLQDESIVKTGTEEPPLSKRICRLSNNLDIFSDEEDDQESQKGNIQPETEKQCINIDDDDDIMLIDEDSEIKDSKKKDTVLEVRDVNSNSDNIQAVAENTNQPIIENNACVETKEVTGRMEEKLPSVTENKDTIEPINDTSDIPVIETNKVAVDKTEETEKSKKPLLPKNFINTCKKNLSDMTRNDLEEFCILKIVESIVDRSNLGEIKAHLKNLTQTMEECKKKCLMLSKQNKDLQIVLRAVQEEQKCGSDVHITPLKITRSVGMQVMMVADKNNIRKKPINGVGSQNPVTNNNTKQVKNQQTQIIRNQKEKALMNQQIPVPRLVPATPPAVKTNQTTPNSTVTKQVNNNALPNGIRNSPPVQKIAEKRTRSQAVTVDLTDDEPPAKLQNVQRGPINQPMRVITTGANLLPAQRFTQNMNSPRKVYIPISGPQAQNVRPGQTIMLKTLSGLGPRPRGQAQTLITKAPQTASPVRFGRGQPNRHPAPLPDAMKQYQPPNWKSLPPAPDLKLSKVENGIVISWKIDGYQEDNHEEIASYQLYAYQETSSPPNTALWKKIGDVKALPLPMACTLTQFMAGYKYYFAVRAVDIRSRFGPFSLPGSILLLNKM